MTPLDQANALLKAEEAYPLMIVRHDEVHSEYRGWSRRSYTEVIATGRPGNNQFAWCADDEDAQAIMCIPSLASALLEKQKALEEAEARLSRLSALLDEAEAALGPFAREGTRQHKGDIEIKYLLPEDTRVLMVYQGPPHFYFDRPIMPEITAGDLRLAASVAAKIAKEKSE